MMGKDFSHPVFRAVCYSQTVLGPLTLLGFVTL